MTSLDFWTLVLQAVLQQQQHPIFVSFISAHNLLLGMLTKEMLLLMRHRGL